MTHVHRSHSDASHKGASKSTSRCHCEERCQYKPQNTPTFDLLPSLVEHTKYLHRKLGLEPSAVKGRCGTKCDQVWKQLNAQKNRSTDGMPMPMGAGWADCPRKSRNQGHPPMVKKETSEALETVNQRHLHASYVELPQLNYLNITDHIIPCFVLERESAYPLRRRTPVPKPTILTRRRKALTLLQCLS